MATVKITTPKGELRWVTISGEGRENLNGTMQYLATLVLDPKTAKPLMDQAKKFYAENRNKSIPAAKPAKTLGWSYADYDLDANGEKQYDDDGKVMMDKKGPIAFQFKTATTYPDGKQKVVRVYNSKKKPVDIGDTQIGNGSIGHVAGVMSTYEVRDKSGKKVIDGGVTLYLDSVLLLKLVEFQGDSGFGDIEVDEDDDNFTGDEGWTGETEAADESAKPRL